MTDRSDGFERDERSAERDEAARVRDVQAGLRDGESAARDALADLRTDTARTREQVLRDRLWADRPPVPDQGFALAVTAVRPDARAAYEQALIDLAMAESSTEWARSELSRVLDDVADERVAVETDRRAAELDRLAGQSDRRAAAEDRRAAQADRFFSAGVRDQVEIDAQLDQPR